MAFLDAFRWTQPNQFSSGQLSDPNANTNWMSSGIVSNQQSAPVQQQPQASTPSNINSGTAVGAMNQGSFQNGMQQPQQNNWGMAPLGFEQDKWNDPNLGTSLKYQVGRMAAQGVPIQEIANKVGAKVISPDKIQYPDGFVADIYFDYGGPNQRVQYTDVTPEGQYKPGSAPTLNNNPASFMGFNQPTQQQSIQQPQPTFNWY